jgi:hypothetical protein
VIFLGMADFWQRQEVWSSDPYQNSAKNPAQKLLYFACD